MWHPAGQRQTFIEVAALAATICPFCEQKGQIVKAKTKLRASPPEKR